MSRHHRALDRRKWERTRAAVLDRDRYRCSACGKAGILEVDHVDPLSKHPEQDPYDPAGCQALCRECHHLKTIGELGRSPDPERARWKALVALITAE